jgi:hypothetical protein
VIISVNSLPDLIRTIGVEDVDFSVGEDVDNRWCILQRPDGAWAVFYRERGGNFDESTFDLESDACYNFLGRMTLLQITRGCFQIVDEPDESDCQNLEAGPDLVTLATVEEILEGMGSWHRAACVGEAEMCYCIARDDDSRWSVFYMERGCRDRLREFTDEQAACLEFMGRVAGEAKVVEWLTERGRTDLISSVDPMY